MKVKRILVFLIELVIVLADVNTQVPIQTGYLPPERTGNNNNPGIIYAYPNPSVSNSQVPFAGLSFQNPSGINTETSNRINPSSPYSFPSANGVYSPNIVDNVNNRLPPAVVYSNLSPLLNPPTGNSPDTDISFSGDSSFNLPLFNQRVPSYGQLNFNQPQFGNIPSYTTENLSEEVTSSVQSTSNILASNSGRRGDNFVSPFFPSSGTQEIPNSPNNKINNEYRIPSLFSPFYNTPNQDNFVNLPSGFDDTSKKSISIYGSPTTENANDLANINPSSTAFTSSFPPTSLPESISLSPKTILPAAMSSSTIAPSTLDESSTISGPYGTEFPNSSTLPSSNVADSTSPNSNEAPSYSTNPLDSSTPVNIGGAKRPLLTNGIFDSNSNINSQKTPTSNYPASSFGSYNTQGSTSLSNNLNELSSSGPIGRPNSNEDNNSNDEFSSATKSDNRYRGSTKNVGNSPRLHSPIVVGGRGDKPFNSFSSNDKYSGTGNKYTDSEGETSNFSTKDDSNGKDGNNDIDDQAEPAKYEFNYNVNDGVGNEFGHQESRNGNFAQGSYKVVLPDGRKLVVDYVADEDGYRPRIRYEDANGINGLANGNVNVLNENNGISGDANTAVNGVNYGNTNNELPGQVGADGEIVNGANYGNTNNGQLAAQLPNNIGTSGAIGTDQLNFPDQATNPLYNDDSGQNKQTINNIAGTDSDKLNYPNYNDNNYRPGPNNDYGNGYSNADYPNVNNVNNIQANRAHPVLNVDKNSISGTNDIPGANYPSDINKEIYSGENYDVVNYPNNGNNENRLNYPTDNIDRDNYASNFGGINQVVGIVGSNFLSSAPNTAYGNNHPPDQFNSVDYQGSLNDGKQPSGSSIDNYPEYPANTYRDHFNGFLLDDNNRNARYGNSNSLNDGSAPETGRSNDEQSRDNTNGFSNISSSKPNQQVSSFSEQDGYKYKRSFAKRL